MDITIILLIIFLIDIVILITGIVKKNKKLTIVAVVGVLITVGMAVLIVSALQTM